MKRLPAFCVWVAALLAAASCDTAPKDAGIVRVAEVNQPSYEIYPTENMWNFIKLNTVDGRMWMVQYSVDSDSTRFESVLNAESLLAKGQQSVKGRFVLVPTRNMWNFILLDQVDGKQWQVQWTTDGNHFVVPIR